MWHKSNSKSFKIASPTANEKIVQSPLKYNDRGGDFRCTSHSNDFRSCSKFREFPVGTKQGSAVAWKTIFILSFDHNSRSWRFKHQNNKSLYSPFSECFHHSKYHQVLHRNHINIMQMPSKCIRMPSQELQVRTWIQTRASNWRQSYQLTLARNSHTQYSTSTTTTIVIGINSVPVIRLVVITISIMLSTTIGLRCIMKKCK